MFDEGGGPERPATLFRGSSKFSAADDKPARRRYQRAMTRDTTPPGVRLRLVFEPDTAFGPGKADLLEGIAETGSIAAAGRRMGMSYKRAWTLVEEMNGMFELPLVHSSRGGAAGGGARLTADGERALDLYRRLEAKAREAGRNEIAQLRAMARGAGGGTSSG